MHKGYPQSIAPRRDYRYRLPMRKLLKDFPNLAVVRRCKDKNPFAYSTSGKRRCLKTDVLEENLLEMSVNLLGGPYKTYHLPYKPKKELVDHDWDGQYEQTFPLPEDSFSIVPTYGAIFFRIAEANRFVFPYPKSIEKKDYDGIKRKAKIIQKREGLDVKGEIVGDFGASDNKMTSVHARLHVNHHPNDLNYWHMQMDAYAVAEDKYVRYEDKGNETRRIRHQLREFISRIAIQKLDSNYYIGRNYYIRGLNPILIQFDYLKTWIYSVIRK